MKLSEPEIKRIIQAESSEKYNGSYRFFKPKLTIKLIGEENYEYIKSKIDKDLQYNPSILMYCFINDILVHPKCPCGNKVTFNTATMKFKQYCGNACRGIYCKHLHKTGKDNQFYGESGKRLAKESNFKKYGVTNYTKTDEYKSIANGRIRDDSTKEKTKLSHLKLAYATIQEKSPNFTPLFTFEEYCGVRKKYKWKCKSCDLEFVARNPGILPTCPKCKPKGSKHEIVLQDWLHSHRIPFIFNYRKLKSGKEIDFYFENIKFGIELCGLYWHSDAFSDNPPEKHISKHDECLNNKIELFTIFDDEMFNLTKRKMVINKLKRKLIGNKYIICSNLCKACEINKDVGQRFLEKYHHNACSHSDEYYGLFYKNKLVSVTSFSKNNIWGLDNYATNFQFDFVGGYKIILNEFIKKNSPKMIFCKLERRWDSGEILESLGFQSISVESETCTYTKNFKERTNSYEMEEKYFRVWNCGSENYILNLDILSHQSIIEL